MISVSWVVLTYNRAETVVKSVMHNLAQAGRCINQIIWVDNGSASDQRTKMIDDVFWMLPRPDRILNDENLGVAKGTNQGYRAAECDYIVSTQCDTLMPDNWLLTMEEYITAVPGVAAMFTVDISLAPERSLGDPITIGGLTIQPAIPMPFHITSKELFEDVIGYYREDFGLYGWEDVEWARRAAYRCAGLRDYRTYCIPGQTVQHLGSEGVAEWNGLDEKEYHEFKQAQVQDAAKQVLMEKLKAENWPYYNPYK